MLIAVDFDGCYAEDPVAWRKALDELVAAGHQIVLVTQRTEEWKADVLLIWPDRWPIVWAGGVTKRAAARNAGYDPDVWIDDTPATVDLIALNYIGG